jgi:hypothetical protein
MPQELEAYGLTWPMVAGAAAAFVLLLVVVAVVRRLRRKQKPQPKPLDLTLDVSTLGEYGPRSGEPTAELYHVPMRLAAIVLAPTGRGTSLPDSADAAAVAEALVPGLGEVVAVQRPRIVRWPAQLSSQGFSNTFFSLVRLPGDRGRGTPWCAVAGRCESDGKKLLVGLVCCADAPNSLGQITVERESQWLDLLRVKI